MRQQRAIIGWLLLLMAPWFAAAGLRAECTARSGADTAVLVELYLPTGCPDCARAERWLESLGEIAVALPPALPEHVSRRALWCARGWRSRRGLTFWFRARSFRAGTNRTMSTR